MSLDKNKNNIYLFHVKWTNVDKPRSLIWKIIIL
ncbi:hypothetical protein BGW94_0394 [Fibrobacter sp. NR9]|nr:hypothetical protein BGW94_0394 [Fibrobacter sp. NR9]